MNGQRGKRSFLDISVEKDLKKKKESAVAECRDREIFRAKVKAS